jgi:hypothetical protein
MAKLSPALDQMNTYVDRGKLPREGRGIGPERRRRKREEGNQVGLRSIVEVKQKGGGGRKMKTSK